MALDLARMLVRAGELDQARAVVRTASAAPDADRPAFRDVVASIDEAEQRRWTRGLLIGVLALLVVVAAWTLRRATGSWGAAARRIARPPSEVVFLVPLTVLLVVVGETGNPLVARAVRTIAIAGVVIAWMSGAVVEAMRCRAPIGLGRIALHAALAVLAVAICAYLALDRDRVVDLLLETLRGGHALE